MQISNLRAITIADEAGERERPAFEAQVDALCADLHSSDPAVVAAAEATIGQIVGAAVRASGIGAPA